MSEASPLQSSTMLLAAETRQSLCPVCLQRITARHEAEGDTILLVKRCPQHGEFRTPVWRGEPAMQSWKKPKLPTPPAPDGTTKKGCPFDCGLCPEHNQHTCTVLFEITARCNLRCRFCFASAGEQQQIPDPDIDELRDLMDAVRPQTGPCNVQLSGGEPTMRDDLPDIIRMAKQRFGFVQINTNGLRIAQQPELAQQLAKAGLDSAFLQFDGTTDDIYKTLRGAPLLQQKLQAINLMGQAGIGVVLVPTVVPAVNDHNLGDILKLGAAYSPVVRGVHFQPVSHFGRYPTQTSESGLSSQNAATPAPPHTARITLPEVMRNLEAQTERLVTTQDFLPPGCEHSLCSFHANYMIREDNTFQRLSVQRSACDCKPRPASEGADAAKAFVKRQWASAPLQSIQNLSQGKAPVAEDCTTQYSGTSDVTCYKASSLHTPAPSRSATVSSVASSHNKALCADTEGQPVPPSSALTTDCAALDNATLCPTEDACHPQAGCSCETTPPRAAEAASKQAAEQASKLDSGQVSEQISGQVSGPTLGQVSKPNPGQHPAQAKPAQAKPMDDLDRFIQRAATHTFAVSAMAFQDVWNIDLERIQGCCIHVAAPDGRLVPFCAWNCTSASGKALHRNSHRKITEP